MNDGNRPTGDGDQFTRREGLGLTLSYMHDPAAVPCPRCGPGTIEVAAFLDAEGAERGVFRAAEPEGEYTVLLFCHDCRRSGALHLRPDRHGVPRGRDDDASDADDSRRAA